MFINKKDHKLASFPHQRSTFEADAAANQSLQAHPRAPPILDLIKPSVYKKKTAIHNRCSYIYMYK